MFWVERLWVEVLKLISDRAFAVHALRFGAHSKKEVAKSDKDRVVGACVPQLVSNNYSLGVVGLLVHLVLVIK